MERLKGYLAYLLIPVIPYLLMIYSPETIDPLFQYLAHGKGHKLVWVVMFSIFLVSMYFGIVADAKAREAKSKLIAFTKWYLFIVAIVVSVYILLFNAASLKYAFWGVSIAIIIFYMYLTNSGKKNA